MYRISATTLAEFILASYGDRGITPMKLQKLVYYVKAWSLVAGKDFVNAEFERWDYGPVSRDIYYRYQGYSRSNIPIPFERPRLASDQEDFVRFIVDNYIDLSAVALSMQTHREDPWINTQPNSVISERAMRDYYSQQNFARNFSRNDYRRGRFFVVKTNSWHSFTMDMDAEESAFYESYPSYEEYVSGTQKAASEIDNLVREFLSNK